MWIDGKNGMVQFPNAVIAKIEYYYIWQNEIVVQQPTVVESAQPVLTASERLRKNDRLIFAALAEKHQILAELLNEGEEEAGTSRTMLEVGEKRNQGPDWHNLMKRMIRSNWQKRRNEELERIADQMTGQSVPDLKQRNPRELAMSAIGRLANFRF